MIRPKKFLIIGNIYAIKNNFTRIFDIQDMECGFCVCIFGCAKKKDDPVTF